MAATQTFTGTLVVLHCYKCHVVFGLTKDHYDRAHRSGDTFYCTNGHGQVFGKTREEELEAALALAKRRQGWAESRALAAQDQADTAERSARAYKGHLTRARNKIANGVCPVPNCRRSFSNVHGHMERMHPDWGITDPETGEKAVL